VELILSRIPHPKMHIYMQVHMIRMHKHYFLINLEMELILSHTPHLKMHIYMQVHMYTHA
jgi:hypothetical protein